MRTIIRDNYEPETGEYHNRIVKDAVNNKVWLFDCDGAYTDLTKTWVKVKDEEGDSETDAISQRLFTETTKKLNDTINDVDEGLQMRIAEVEATAVTAVELTNDEEMALAVTTDGEKLNQPVREANESRNGLMSKEAYSQVISNTEAISRLQNAGLYRGSFATLEAAPTTNESEEFVGGEIYNNDFITIQEAEYEGKKGVAHYRASVTDNTVTYTFETFIDQEIANFAEGKAGLVVGGTEPGELGAQTGGTGKVNGWTEMAGKVDSAVASVATLSNKVDEVSKSAKPWIDITNTGMPPNPDANTFYYTAE